MRPEKSAIATAVALAVFALIGLRTTWSERCPRPRVNRSHALFRPTRNKRRRTSDRSVNAKSPPRPSRRSAKPSLQAGSPHSPG